VLRLYVDDHGETTEVTSGVLSRSSLLKRRVRHGVSSSATFGNSRVLGSLTIHTMVLVVEGDIIVLEDEHRGSFRWLCPKIRSRNNGSCMVHFAG